MRLGGGAGWSGGQGGGGVLKNRFAVMTKLHVPSISAPGVPIWRRVGLGGGVAVSLNEVT